VGRSRELALFDQVAEAAGSGPQFVAVTGDPGIGKTHLLTAVHRRLAGAGWQVVSGRARGNGAQGPCGLLVDAFDGALDSVSPHLSPRDSALLAEVFPSASPGSSADGYRVGRALLSVLRLLSEQAPLLVLLDDVHQADAGSLEALDFLLHHPPRGRVLFAAAHRPGRAVGLPWQGPTANGRLPVWLVTPRPLDDGELDSLMPPGTPFAQRATLREACVGRPGVLRALLRSRPTVSGRAYGIEELRIGVPPALPGAFPTEPHRLTPLARLVAEAAAVVGDPFEPDQVAAVAQLAEPDVLLGIDELLSVGLLRAKGVWRRFSFRDLAVRADFYHASGGGWRCGAHDRAARVLAGRGLPAARCAHHLEQAAAVGDTAAAALLLTAARETVHVAPDRAIRWLRTCERLLPERAPTELHTLSAVAFAATGRISQSLQSYQAVEAAPESERDLKAEAAEWCVRALRLDGRHAAAQRLLLRAGSPDRHAPGLRLEAVTLAYELGVPAPESDSELMRIGRDERRPARAQAQALLALLALDQGRAPDAAAYWTAAQSLVDGLPDDTAACRVEAMYWLAEAELRLGEHECAARHLRRGLDLADRYAQIPIAHRMRSGLDRLRSPGAPAPHLPPGPSRLSLPPPPPPRAVAAERVTRSTLGLLSNRELDIARLVSEGLTNQQIATKLTISPKTVETYLTRVFKKLEVTSRAQVAHQVGRAGAA
jgi:DNA-binding CsgD family transcriptional regulator